MNLSNEKQAFVPSNEIAEKAVLCGLLNDITSPSQLEAEGITKDVFHCHKRAFVEVSAFAKNGGGNHEAFIYHAALHGFIDDIGTGGFVQSCAEMLPRDYIERALPSYLSELKKCHAQRQIQTAAAKLERDPSDQDALDEMTAAQGALAGCETQQAGGLSFTAADDIEESEGAFDFVEDLLTEGAASVIYGASNSGKTFFALDIAACVATGREWMESQCELGAVIYIALEGQHGAKSRIRALQQRDKLPSGSPFYLCFSPVNLLDPTHPARVQKMIAEVQNKTALPVRLVILDTLARAIAGGDENSGQDMGRAVASIDSIRNATGAHVCIIHHSGKDAARGARGHSSLRAAVDTEIEVVHPEGGDKYRTATVVKQRDIGTHSPICFSLEVVEVGTNRRGKPITSCTVKEEDSIMAHSKGRPGAKPKYNAEMLLSLLPQPTVKAWQQAARDGFGMGKDAFEDHKSRCASQWRKTKQGGIALSEETLEL